MEAFQETVRKSGPAAMGSYSLIGAIILLGGVGYAVDQWRGSSPWFLLAVGLYGEAFTPAHMAAFGLIWAALALHTFESTRPKAA